MSTYTPDKWVVLRMDLHPEIYADEDSPIFKVFGCWYGGFEDGDSWRMNSGIKEVTFDDELFAYTFVGFSGSTYICRQSHYGTHLYGSTILSTMEELADSEGCHIEILPEDTDWLALLAQV